MRYMPRVVDGLQSVNLIAPPPFSIRRRKGMKAKGLAFERRVMRELGKQIPDMIHGQWFGFTDVNGIGMAQPDIHIVRDNGVFIFELKTKETPKAWLQLFNLYKPLLEFYYKKPAYCLQIVEVAMDKQTQHLNPLTLLREPKLGYYAWILQP